MNRIKVTVVQPFDFVPISSEDLDVEANEYLKGYREQPYPSMFKSSEDYWEYTTMRRRKIMTWMLSYDCRLKYVKAIAKAAGIRKDRCNIIYKREMREAWLLYQEHTGGSRARKSPKHW